MPHQGRRWLLLGIGIFVGLIPWRGEADVLGQFTGMYDARTLLFDEFEAAVSFAAVHDEKTDFFHTDQERLSLPRLYVAHGIGPHAFVEASWDYRFVDDDRTGGANGSGDLRLGIQVGIAPRAWRSTDLAARFGVKMPNADETLSLGTNETDVIGLLVVRHTVAAEWNLLFQAGAEILGDPRESAVQDDVLNAALGLEFHRRGWQSRFGVAMREATTNGNDAERVVWATRGPLGRNTSWVVGAEAGIGGLAADWGVQAGISTTGSWGGK